MGEKKSRYAEGTTVSVDNSQAELRRTVARYGGDMVSFGWSGEGRQVVGFRYRERFLRFDITLPSYEQIRAMLKSTQSRYRWSEPPKESVQKIIDAEERRLWRVLILRVKTKLEMVESGNASFEEEFGWNLQLQNGRTSGEIFSHMLTEGHPALPAPRG